MNRVAIKVGSPTVEILGSVARGHVGRHEPEHVSPAKASIGAMDVLFLVGVGVMAAVVGHPANRSSFGRPAADRGENILQPLRPDGVASMGQQAVIGQRDADPAGQPVEEETDCKSRPGKELRHERQARPEVKEGHPGENGPGNVSLLRLFGGGQCRHAKPSRLGEIRGPDRAGQSALASALGTTIRNIHASTHAPSPRKPSKSFDRPDA